MQNSKNYQAPGRRVWQRKGVQLAGTQMKPITLQDYKLRLLRVLVHIQTRLDEPLFLDELARCAFFSPYHFHEFLTTEHWPLAHEEREATEARQEKQPIALKVGKMIKQRR